MDNSNHLYVIEIANRTIRCSFEFLETASFFSDYVKNIEPVNKTIVKIDHYDKELWDSRGNVLNPYGEYSLLCGGVSDYLLNHNACLIHAVAFCYNNKAYLIIAPPGVGKSTQIKYLMDIYPNQFGVICGDRPCLSFEKNNRILVYPTPWNGKENWHGANACELVGIFYLKRGQETNIQKLDKRSAVFPIFASLISRRETVEDVKFLGMYSEMLIENIPVYLFINGGVPESTKVLYDTINKGEILDEI